MHTMCSTKCNQQEEGIADVNKDSSDCGNVDSIGSTHKASVEGA